jgi:predicted DNA binding CopG/RHH family protein
MKNKNYTVPDKEIYTKEELELFEQIEAGNYDSMPKEELKKEKEFYKQVATNTIKKITRKKSLNLRVYEEDISRIKGIALEKGLPYQTFLASIIHQIATKQIKV